MVAEPVNTTVSGKSYALTASYYKAGSNLFSEFGEEQRRPRIAEPVCVAERGRYGADGIEQHYEPIEDGKTNVLTTVQKDNQVCEPVCVQEQVFGRKAQEDGTYDRRYEAKTDAKSGTLTRNMGQNAVAVPVGTTRDGKSYCLTAGYANGSGEKIGNYAAHTLEKGCKSMVAVPVGQPDRVGCFPSPDGTLRNSQGMRLYSTEGKSVNLTAQGGGLGAKTGLYTLEVPTYAEAVEWDEYEKPIKAISYADGKEYTVYEVKDGQITIKGKTYHIKLKDGFYIIRKLTVRECMRLQTVPEWYEFPVSNTQAIKMLGNGWTISVIHHLLQCIMRIEKRGESE
jgi:site-specific DNA-cytosine methylase